jgi:CheY-like chemotaxis protein
VEERVLRRRRKAEKIMTDETILYVSDQTANNNSVLTALKATGYEVVSTNSATQAIALLYVLHTVAGVVLNHRARARAKFDVVRSLRAIRSGVPIVLLCGEQIKRLPSSVDACVDTRQPLEKLTAAVRRRLLNAKCFQKLIAQL